MQFDISFNVGIVLSKEFKTEEFIGRVIWDNAKYFPTGMKQQSSLEELIEFVYLLLVGKNIL